MSFDGIGFIRCDDAMVEGVTSNAPLDVFADFKIRHNERVLYARSHPISFTPFSGNSTDNTDQAGIRPTASLRRTTFLQVPWIVYPGLTQVRLRVFGHIEDPEFEGLNMKVGMGLRGIGSKMESLTFRTTPKASAYVIEWDLNSPIVQPVTTDFHVDIQSVPGIAQLYQTASDARGSGPLYQTVGLDADMYPVSYTAQGTNDPSLQFTQIWPDGEAQERRFDHLAAIAAGSMWIRPESPGGALPYSESPELWGMSYICLRGFAVEFIYRDGTKGGGIYRELPPEVYRANQVVGAAESGQHVDNIIGIHRRPRPLYVGPTGQAPPSESGWPTGYAERFRRVFDNITSDPAASTELDLDMSSISPSSVNPSIRAEFNLLPYHYVPRYIASSDVPDFSRVAWDVTLYVEEFATSSSAWVELASTTEQIVCNHHLTDQSGRWTALLNERIRVRNYRDSSPAGSSYVYKEGQLYPEDFELLQRHSIEVPVTYDPAEQNVRFRLTAQMVVSGTDAPVYSNDASTDEVPTVASSGETFQDFKWLVLMLTGATVWEFPNEL